MMPLKHLINVDFHNLKSVCKYSVIKNEMYMYAHCLHPKANRKKKVKCMGRNCPINTQTKG